MGNGLEAIGGMYRKVCLHIGLKRNGLAAICDLSKGCWLFAYMKIGFKELVA